MKTKKIITWTLATVLCTAGFNACSDDYDDTNLKNQIGELDKRVTSLEEKVKTDVAGVQAAIATLNGNDYVKSIVATADGYQITFSKGTVATIKNGTPGATPVITAEKYSDGKFYWKMNGNWLTGSNNEKVPTSIAPEITASTDEQNPSDTKNYWKINGQWLLDAQGQKIQVTADAEPVNFDAEVASDGSTVTFTFGDQRYPVNVAKGGLKITEPEDLLLSGTPAIYAVALPEGWLADEVEAVRADIASASTSAIAITRAAGSEKWAIQVAKTLTGADVTVTGTDIPAGEVAELTVTFVKKTTGERVDGSVFVTVWENQTTSESIAVTSAGDVATAIRDGKDQHKIFSNIDITGSVAMDETDWIALKENKYLTSLTVSNTAITAIPASAFEDCANLSSFTGNASMTEIGASAFKNCTSLVTLNTVNRVVTIDASAFEGCASLTNPTFDTLTTLGASAFSGCEALTALPSLDASITELPANVFNGCSAITTVTLANIETIGEGAFAGSGLTVGTFAAATSIGATAFANCSAATAFTFAVVTYVGEGAFEGVAYDGCDVTLGTGSTGDPDADSDSWLTYTWKSVTIN